MSTLQAYSCSPLRMQFLIILILFNILINLALGADIIYIDHGEIIQFNEGSSTSIIRVTHPHVRELDMNWRTQTIYYSDRGSSSTSTIYMVTVDGTVTRLLSVSGLVSSIALDWINNNVYFIDYDAMTVNKLNLATLQHDVIYTEVRGTYPASIIVDPRRDQGYIYWYTAAYITRAKLDGSDMERIIQSDIIWPYAMTIDLSDDSIYWVNSGLDTIFSRCDLNGMNRVTLRIDRADVPVDGITVYNGVRLIWTSDGIINKIDLSNCNQDSCIVTPLETYRPYNQPTEIKILDETRQPGSNQTTTEPSSSCLIIFRLNDPFHEDLSYTNSEMYISMFEMINLMLRNALNSIQFTYNGSPLFSRGSIKVFMELNVHVADIDEFMNIMKDPESYEPLDVDPTSIRVLLSVDSTTSDACCHQGMLLSFIMSVLLWMM